MWTTEHAIDLCKRIEEIAPKFGCHVALTGGLLYKVGERKDCDIVLYRIRQEVIDRKGLFAALKEIGIEITYNSQWVIKATLHGERKIDFFFPDTEDDGEYDTEEMELDDNGLPF